jgi:hypothetical protein
VLVNCYLISYIICEIHFISILIKHILYEALFNNAVSDNSRICGSVSTVLVSFARSTGVDMS